MGMSAGGGEKNGVHHEINVTPLIDVLLVLLIIFLVVMPIMMKMETLQVPRKLNDENEMPDPNATMLVVKVKVDGQMIVDDNGKETTIMPADLLRTIRPRIEGMKSGTEKVVFVDFEDAVPWGEVITTMDTIRSLATDENHDEIKVALKIKEDKPAGTP
ncbi:MAG: biopolymer transporter ExbD [Myxococcota bacterium]|nr:biopolymer transporter ExbD [Myxococcota bacterium]